MIQTPMSSRCYFKIFSSLLAALLLWPVTLTAPASAQPFTSPGMRFGLNTDALTYTDQAYTDVFLEAWWGGDTVTTNMTSNNYPTQMSTDGYSQAQVWFCIDGDKTGSNQIYNFYGEGIFTLSRLDGAFLGGGVPWAEQPVTGTLSVLPPNYPGNPSSVAITVPPNSPANPNATPPTPANPYPIPLVIPANSPANPLNVVVTTCQYAFNIPTQPTAGYYLAQSMPLNWISITNINPTNLPGENMNNFHLIRPGYPAWQPGNAFFPVSSTSFPIFTTEFLNIYAPFCAIRFMNWMQTNGNTGLSWGANGIVNSGTYSWAQREPCNAGQYFGCGGGNCGNSGGAAYEFMIALCNATGCDMWMNVPLQATDDWKVGFANLIVNDPVYHLNPWLHVYYEHGNELWNWGFIAWQIVEQWAQADFPAQEQTLGAWYCHGMETGKLLMSDVNVMQPIFGANVGRPILAGQVVNPTSYCGGGLYYIQTTYGPPQNYLYGIAGAPYFDTTTTDITGSLQQAVAANVALAAQYPGLFVCSYETGQGLASSPESTFVLDEALQSSPQMTNAYYTFGNMWQSTGGDLAMFFSTTGVDSQFGYWGHVPLTSLMDDLTNAALTKYNAIAAFNNYYGCNCGNAAPPPPPPPAPPPSSNTAPAPPAPVSTTSSSGSTSSSSQSATPATGHWVNSKIFGRYYEYGSKDDPMTPHH